jgi:hypothetical protein
MDHDTAEFAVETIRLWWRTMGRPAYPEATRLLITADAGGGNGSRLRIWKVELQKLANETGLRIAVCHFPPGTSEWNKIEHRLFSYITQDWRGKPLRSLQTIVNLIAATTTKTGLKIHAERRDKFHGDWNYEIEPRHPSL